MRPIGLSSSRSRLAGDSDDLVSLFVALLKIRRGRRLADFSELIEAVSMSLNGGLLTTSEPFGVTSGVLSRAAMMSAASIGIAGTCELDSSFLPLPFFLRGMMCG